MRVVLRPGGEIDVAHQPAGDAAVERSLHGALDRQPGSLLEFDDPIGMEARIGEVADEDPAGEVAGE
jgi:hypothetical protein